MNKGSIVILFCFLINGIDLFGQVELSEEEDTLITYSIIEKPASYQGGFLALKKVVKDNFIYPEMALEFGFEGDLKVTVEIDTDGECKLMGITTLFLELNGKKVNPTKHNNIVESMKDEARRLVNLLQDWNPGTINNRSVTSRVKFPIYFDIKD